MVVLRAFGALVAGFAVALLLALGLKALLDKMAPSLESGSGKPGAGYAVVQLGGTFVCGGAGGFATALAAKGNPLSQVLVLSIVLLVLAALSAMQERGKQPVWYLLAQVALTPVGAMVGGMARLHAVGIL